MGFSANSLVYTDDNYKKIIDVKRGDVVLTHNDSNKKVLDIKQEKVTEYYKIYGAGTDKIECTSNQCFYATNITEGKMTTPERINVKDLTTNHYLLMPINDKSIIPKMQGVSLNMEGLWYRIGELVYMLSSKLRHIDTKHDNDAINQLISMFIDEKKHVFIPNFVLDLPINLLKKFVDGFIATKKSRSRDDGFSYMGKRKFIYMLAQCIAKVYKKPFTIKETFMINECKIELDPLILPKDVVYTSKYLLYKIKSIEKELLENSFYTIEDSQNESYVVNNCVVG